MKLLFMCVIQKCNFYLQKYDILVIFVKFEFPMIFADFLLPGTASLIWIRIHITAPSRRRPVHGEDRVIGQDGWAGGCPGREVQEGG